MFCTFIKAFPLGEGGIKRGIDGTVDDSGFASQTRSLRTLSTLRTLSNLSVRLADDKYPVAGSQK